MSRRKILFISIPVFILLCGIAGFLFVSSDYFLENFVKDRLIEAIQDEINKDYQVEIERLKGNVLTGVEVENLSVSKVNANTEPVLSTKQVVLKYDIIALLRRKLVVKVLELDLPKINIVRDSVGKLNLTEMLQKTTPDPKRETEDNFTFAIANVLIKQGSVQFSDAQQKIELSLPEISLDLKGQLERWDHTGSFSIGNGGFTINETLIPFEQLVDMNFAISTTGSGLSGPFRLKLGNSLIEIKEFERAWDQGEWKTLIALTIDTRDVQKIIQNDIELAGISTINVDLNGTNSTINGKIEGRSDTLSIRENVQQNSGNAEPFTRRIDLTDIVIDTSVDISDDPKITLNEFSGRTAEGSVSTSGGLTLDKGVEGNLFSRFQRYIERPVSYYSNISVEGIQLQSLISMFVEMTDEMPNVDSGVINGSVNMNGNSADDIHIDGEVSLLDTSIIVHDRDQEKTYSLADSSLKCVITSEVGKASTIDAEGNIDESRVEIGGSLDNIDLKMTNIDFGKLCDIAKTVPFSGYGDLSARIDKGGTATGFVEIPRAYFGNPKSLLGRMSGNLRCNDKVVYIENANLSKESINGKTDVSINGNVKLTDKLPSNFTIATDSFVLDSDFNRIFFQQKHPINGNIAGELKLFGYLIDKLDGKGIFTVDSGNAWGINLDPVTVQMEIDDYSLSIPSFEITTQGQQLYLNAQASNDGEYDFTVKNRKGNPIQISKLALASEITDFPLEGTMDVNVHSFQKKHEDIVFQVDFNFTDLSFQNNPLGDAVLHGTLVKSETDEPDYFRFTGEAFEGTSIINGQILTTEDSPYKFTIESENIPVSPILRIFDHRLEAISGTADGRVEVVGTVTDLVEPEHSPLSFPYDVDIIIDNSRLQYKSVEFSNPNPVKMRLEDDILTILDSSLNFINQQSPFLELIGTFDTKNEIIDISVETDHGFSIKPLGTAFGHHIDGTASYQLSAKGNLSSPDVELKWKLPELRIHTNSGIIDIQNADGQLTYMDSIIDFTPYTLQLLNNKVSVDGKVNVDQKQIENSELNFDLHSANLDLVEFKEIIQNRMPDDLLKQYNLGEEELITGAVHTTIEVRGSFDQPIISLSAHTNANTPIVFGPISKPIILDQFRARTTIRQRDIHIEDVLVNGKMDKGVFQISGETSFSTVDTEDINFNLGVKVEKLDIHELSKIIQNNSISDKAQISGSVDLSGTGLKPHLINAVGKINDFDIQIQNFNLKDKSEFSFIVKNNTIKSDIPLQILSPEMETDLHIIVDGLFADPVFSVEWQGNIKSLLHMEADLPLKWNGNAKYENNLFKISSQLTNNGDKLNLSGNIPFIFAIREDGVISQFAENPIDIRLTGNELPLDFIPGLENIFSRVEGVVDVEFEMKGVYPKLYLQGNTSIEAPYLAIRDFPQPLEKLKLQLNARKDIIEFTEFQFEMGDGLVMLQQNQSSLLTLEGLTPKKLEIYELSLKEYPYSSLLQQTIKNDIIGDFDGVISATLRKLSIPMDSFFQTSNEHPVPMFRETIDFEAVTQNVEADITVGKLTGGFTLLDEQYYFENPQPIPLLLTSGEFKIPELKLVNSLDSEQNALSKPLTFSSFGKWNMRSEMLLNISLDSFDLSTLNSLFADINLDTYKLNGRLSTDINITGTYSNPDVTVSLDGDMVMLNNAQIDDLTGDISYISKDRMWTVPKSNPLRLTAGKNQLNISGSVPYLLSFENLVSEPLNDPMEVLVSLRFDDIGILPIIEPMIDSADGTGSISATVHGTPFEPHLTGECEINLASLILADSPVYLKDAQGQFIFSESELRIQSINGRLNDGSFISSGVIDTDWFSVNHIDIEASLANCSFVETGQYLAEVSTGIDDLRLFGIVDEDQHNNLTLSGDIIIHSGNYEQNLENIRDWFSGRTVSSVELTFGNTFLDDLQLDLGIEIPEDFHFLSSLGGTTDIEITCNGRITGLIQEPIFSGEVTILKGKISMVTQEFDIVEGSRITNEDETAFNPKLDITLRTPNPIRGVLLEDGSTADLMVTATVTGTLENGDIDKARLGFLVDPINSSTTTLFSDAYVLSLLLPGSSISRSFGGITFTLSSGFDPNERHIIAEYPLPRNMSIKVEGDERGDFGVDVQLLERRF